MEKRNISRARKILELSRKNCRIGGVVAYNHAHAHKVTQLHTRRKLNFTRSWIHNQGRFKKIILIHSYSFIYSLIVSRMRKIMIMVKMKCIKPAGNHENDEMHQICQNSVSSMSLEG